MNLSNYSRSEQMYGATPNSEFSVMISVAGGASSEFIERFLRCLRESHIQVCRFLWTQIDMKSEGRIMLGVGALNAEQCKRLNELFQTFSEIRKIHALKSYRRPPSDQGGSQVAPELT